MRLTDRHYTFPKDKGEVCMVEKELLRSHNLDVVASILRGQVKKLEDILHEIENTHAVDSSTGDHLNYVEKDLRLLRKIYLNP